ncbi:hypothetical protein H3N56_03395 [Cetobacterium sp. 2A]|uniref:hypothetical protein n=1 Tax=unclassified Cetobacterium TaxID=2630983 RepID=UPI00163CF257|nr:hypothetical protein [Cetobacterium sp. 2A]MBC2855540.1 hypothetical protein [Cetobacterium sp. 2A]
MKKILALFFIIFNICLSSQDKFSIESLNPSFKDIDSSTIGGRVKELRGTSRLEVEAETKKDTAYLGIGFSRSGNINKDKLIPLKKGRYTFNEFSEMSIELTISNVRFKNRELHTNEINFEENDEEILSFDYYLKIIVNSEKTNSNIKFIAVIDHNQNLKNIDDRTNVLNINLENLTPSLSVNITGKSLDFGEIKFGKNSTSVPIEIEVTGKETPKDITIKYDSKVSLTPKNGIGNPIPVSVTMDGGRMLEPGVYDITREINGKRKQYLELIGKVDIPNEQESGEYNGSIKLRVTYTK